MRILTKTLQTTRVSFDKIPTPVKVIIYSGIAVLVTMLTADIETFDGVWVKYAAGVLGIVANLLAWLLLSLKND